MRHGSRRRADGTRAERGAVVVELAIVSLFLISLFAGTYDYGQAWRTGLTASEASRTGARVGSARAAARDADFAALSGAKAALESAGKLGRVQRVVIFNSTTANGRVPETCKTGSTSACQVITGTAFRTDWEDTLDYTTAVETNGCLRVATAKNWCPTSRNNVQTTAQYYGLWIRLYHPYEFPLLGGGTDVERTTVMRLEPTT